MISSECMYVYVWVYHQLWHHDDVLCWRPLDRPANNELNIHNVQLDESSWINKLFKILIHQCIPWFCLKTENSSINVYQSSFSHKRLADQSKASSADLRGACICRAVPSVDVPWALSGAGANAQPPFLAVQSIQYKPVYVIIGTTVVLVEW